MIGEFVDFDEGESLVRGDGETDGADARVEVEDLVGGDVVLNLFEGELVDGEVDLKKAVRGIGVFLAEDFVGEVVEDWVGLVVLVEAAFDFAVLITP